MKRLKTIDVNNKKNNQQLNNNVQNLSCFVTKEDFENYKQIQTTAMNDLLGAISLISQDNVKLKAKLKNYHKKTKIVKKLSPLFFNFNDMINKVQLYFINQSDPCC